MAFVFNRNEGLICCVFCSLIILIFFSIPVVVIAESPDDTSTPSKEATNDETDAAFDNFPVDESMMYELEVRDYRIHETDETTGFAQTIEVSKHSETMSSVNEVLTQAVGVQVRQMGGLGAYGAASIRGSTPNQVPVLIDGIELNVGGSASVDLGDITLDLFDRVEVYRGSAPMALGAGGIGGALSLKTRAFDAPISAAALTYGSWTTGRLFALHGTSIGSGSALVILSAEGSRGDFDYLNRNGTLLDTSDDHITTRQNNHHQSIGTLFKMDVPMGKWRLIAANDLYAKERGVPGIESVQTKQAALKRLRDTATLKFSRSVGEAGEIQLDIAYTGQRERFADPLLEFNQTSNLIQSATHAMSGALLGAANWNSKHRTTLRLEGRLEVFSHEEQSRGVTVRSSPMRRIRSTIGLEHNWQPIPTLTIVPTITGAMHNLRFSGTTNPTGDGSLSEKAVNSLYGTPALGMKWEPIKGLFLRANVGRYIRPPSMGELFGYAGPISGNPDLKEEVGINSDAGLTFLLRPSDLLSHFRIDAGWFGSWMDDLIVYEQKTKDEVRPENIDAATILGLESALRIGVADLLSIETNYTYLYGVNRSNTPYYRSKRLPGRPAHSAYARLEAGDTTLPVGALVWIDGDFTGHTHLKQSNQDEYTVPARILLGCGYKLSHKKSRLTLTVQVKNMLNRLTFSNVLGNPTPISDFVNFPLPGRTVLVTLYWKA